MAVRTSSIEEYETVTLDSHFRLYRTPRGGRSIVRSLQIVVDDRSTSPFTSTSPLRSTMFYRSSTRHAAVYGRAVLAP